MPNKTLFMEPIHLPISHMIITNNMIHICMVRWEAARNRYCEENTQSFDQIAYIAITVVREVIAGAAV